MTFAIPHFQSLLWMACLALSLGATTAVAAQSSPATVPARTTTLDPDRPDLTNSAHIVDAGLLQVEFGVQHSRTSNQGVFGTPLTLRVGVFDWLEVRAGTDGFVRQATSVSSTSGMGNVQLGTKIRLMGDADGEPLVSLLPTVNLPVASASRGLGSGDADYTLAILTGADLGAASRVDLNYGIGAIGAGQTLPRFSQHLVSVSVSRNLGERITPYVEGVWFSRLSQDGDAVVSIDAGVIYSLTPRVSLDAGFAVGASRAAPDRTLFTGISFIAGDVLGRYGVNARQRRSANVESRGLR